MSTLATTTCHLREVMEIYFYFCISQIKLAHAVMHHSFVDKRSLLHQWQSKYEEEGGGHQVCAPYFRLPRDATDHPSPRGNARLMRFSAPFLLLLLHREASRRRNDLGQG